MVSPNIAFTELTATAHKNFRGEFIDNVTNRNSLLSELMKTGRKRVEDGGTSIVENLEFAENGTFTRYDGYDILPTSQQEVITAAEFPWRTVAVFVGASNDEIRKNSGKSRIINLVNARYRNARNTFKNGLSIDAYGDGTLSKQIGGVQLLISDTGLGTVGGIDSTTNPFWKNVVQSAAAPIQGGGAITPGANTIESLMLAPYLDTSYGDQVNLIVASNDYFAFFHASQTSLKRWVDTDKAKAGFMGLEYHNAKVMHDGGSGIPGAHMYGMNTEYISLVVHRDADMILTDKIRPQQQDAIGQWIIWMGNLTICNRQRQFVIKA